jgi:hypothetical protein
MDALVRGLVERDLRAVEQIVAEAIRNSKADVVVTSPTRETGADIAVWSDHLEHYVGNPLLIQVKLRIQGESDATSATTHLSSLVSASGSSWALLLFGEGPDPESAAWMKSSPNVIASSLRPFLESLRMRSFPDIVRDLRNRRVHGSSS